MKKCFVGLGGRGCIGWEGLGVGIRVVFFFEEFRIF